MRTIVVMRHAKAAAAGATDFERRLADRGLRDATATGEWLAGLGFRPDLALVSAAVRTVQTWENVAIGAGWDLELAEYDESLYEAATTTALDRIQETPADVGSLLVIGHNPTMAHLAQLIDDTEGQASDELVVGLPTSAACLFEFDGEWSDLDEAGATATAFRAVARG